MRFAVTRGRGRGRKQHRSGCPAGHGETDPVGMRTATMLERSGRALIMLALLLYLAPSVDAQVSLERANWQSQFAEIDRYAESLLLADRVPAASIAIVYRDQLVHVRSFGVDHEGKPVTGATAFVLGSMSKSITAVAVMQLVERGQIELDVSARTYLPSFRVASADSGASITIRQLLLHTSGLPQRVSRVSHHTLRGQVDALRTVAPTRAPGEAHAYASANYLVLGAIVEAVSGLPFAEYVERNIFGMLDMRHSFTSRSQALSQGFAGGHVYAFGVPITSSLAEEPARLPTAGLMSSAEDLGRFLAMFLRQGRVGEQQFLTVESVRQTLVGGAPSDGFSYAFGWRDGRIGDVRAVHHGGIVPDFRGKIVMLPDSGWGVVVLTNASSAIPWPIMPTSHRLADDIAARLAGQALPSPESRHRMTFALIAAAMFVLLFLQLRTLVLELRVVRHPVREPGASQRAWRAIVIDVLFLAAITMLLRFVGLSWAELRAGGPDLAWWLVAMASLGAMTLACRVLRARSSQRRIGDVR